MLVFPASLAAAWLGDRLFPAERPSAKPMAPLVRRCTEVVAEHADDGAARERR